MMPSNQYELEDCPKPLHKRMRSTPALDPMEASPAVKEMIKGYIPPSKRNNNQENLMPPSSARNSKQGGYNPPQSRENIQSAHMRRTRSIEPNNPKNVGAGYGREEPR
jgi:hypothetical protein